MRRKTLISLLSVALLAAMALTPVVEAQRGGGRRGEQDGQGGRGPGGQGRRGGGFGGGGFGGGGFGGGGFSRGRGGGGVAILGLLRIEAVREEVKVTEDQQELVAILGDELREGQPDFPENFREMSDEEREQAREAYDEKMRKWSEEQTAVAKDTLKAILEPVQYTRLSQISIQTQGLRALLDPEVASALLLTDEQIQKIEATREANSEAEGDARREMFTGGGGGPGGFDRDAVREKFEALRKEGEAKILAHLTADQKSAFEALKGAKFEGMPDFGSRFGRGGRTGRGPGGGPDGGGRPGRPGGDGGRPQRPQ